MTDARSKTRDEVADDLAAAHFSVEPGISEIIRLVSDEKQEQAADEPIKLLEVNADTVEAGIQPIYLGTHPPSGIFYPSIIIPITPDEFKRPEIWTQLSDEFGWKRSRQYRRTKSTLRPGS
jgi:hypothetical protein